MQKRVNITELLGRLDDISKEGKINITLLKYMKKGKDNNFAISLPDNLNKTLLSQICNYLKNFQGKSCHIFDPVGKDDDEKYEYIDLCNLQEQWKYVKQLIDGAELYKDKSMLAPCATLSITELSLEQSEYTYYLGRQQTAIEKYLERHKVLMSSNDELQDKSNNKVFLFSCDVDFIVREDKDGNGYIFILDRKMFCKIFNYDEEMKIRARQDVGKIKKWKFLKSPDLIYKKIGQKNVYHRLAKVFSDPVYMEQIAKTPAADLKRNLLDRSDGNFDECDFDGDLIKVTDKNIDKVMKMIAKGFRYNFFANRAEES